MKVFIIIPDEPKLEVICRATTPISVLRNEIFQSRGLISNFYKLNFRGKELNNDKKLLKDYDIEDGSAINLIHWNELPTGTKTLLNLKYDCEWRHSVDDFININFFRKAPKSFFFVFDHFTRNHSPLLLFMSDCVYTHATIYKCAFSLFIFLFRFFPHSIYGARQNSKFQSS